MPQFHDLTVTDIRKTIRDAVVVTLTPAQGSDFAFTQGQYLTFRQDFGGTQLRRSYSICAGTDEGILQIGIKKVEGGAFSTWANDVLKPGDVLQAMQPQGRFFTPLEAGHAKTYLGFAGGSGITPVLSLIKTTLSIEPLSTFTLVYANRSGSSIMFREELADLKNIYMGRLSVIHVLENDTHETELFVGRVDEKKCKALFATFIDIDTVDTAFICGPEPMMLTIAASLRAHGLGDKQIKYELFAGGQSGQIAQKAKVAQAKTANLTQATVTLDGTAHSFTMTKGQSMIDAAIENAVDVPFACKAGVCSTCKCKVIEGEVDMIANHALEDYEVEQGYVLSCQSYPLTDRVVLDYDGH